MLARSPSFARRANLRRSTRLVNSLVGAGTKVVAAALRLPYDAAAYASAPAVIATYSLQPPSLEALAGALFGRVPFGGRLPVTVPGA